MIGALDEFVKEVELVLRRARSQLTVRTLMAGALWALVAASCGGADDLSSAEVIELSTSTTSLSETSTTTSSTTSTTTTVAVDPCEAMSRRATEANLDGDGEPDLVDVGLICLGTGASFSWAAPPTAGEPVVWGADVDADGIDEVMFFTHNEPPLSARIYEFDAAAEGGLVPVLDGGEPFAPVSSHHAGPADPGGEAWFGCTDLDGSGNERLAVGTFEFDGGDTIWVLEPVTWGADLSVVRDPAVTGSFPAWEEDPSRLMPGRRFCRADAWAPRIADGCSASGMEPPEPPAEVPGPVAATVSAIVTAAVACDFHELERIAGERITLSFGGHNDVAAFLATGEYVGDDEPLRVLVGLLGMTPAVYRSDETLLVWPGFWGDDSSPTSDEIAQIEAIYGRSWDELTVDVGYLAHRVGIGADGEWQFFVAGD